jgi:hypothetical protein
MFFVIGCLVYHFCFIALALAEVPLVFVHVLGGLVHVV